MAIFQGYSTSPLLGARPFPIGRADFAGFIIFDDNDKEVFSFGKYKGRKVLDVLKENPGYYNWIQNADFPLYTKKVLTSIRDEAKANKHTNTLEDLKNKFNNKI